MAEFGFTEVHEMLRRQVRGFARRELLPGFKERASLSQVPRELVRKLAGMEYISANLPEEYGGQNLDTVSMGIICEELNKADCLSAHVVRMPWQFCKLLIEDGSEEQRLQWVPQLVNGELIVGFCLTEPGCGSDAAAIQTRAVRDGDYYVINGEKTSVTFGLQADLLLVFAKTAPAAGARGVSCFLVPGDTPGLTKYRMADMGWHPHARASIMFDDVRIPAGNLVGEEGKGFHMAMRRFDIIRVMLSLEALAQAQTSLDETIAYARQRAAFGKPIGKYEGISFKIAENLTLIEVARLLCYRTLWMHDQGIRHIKETAMCKWFAPQVASKVIHDCLLTFGHIGYSGECPIQQRLRDVMGYEIADGTADIQKLIIAREVLGREFLPY